MGLYQKDICFTDPQSGTQKSKARIFKGRIQTQFDQKDDETQHL